MLHKNKLSKPPHSLKGPLNQAQIDLLRAAEKHGLSATIIGSWSPYPAEEHNNVNSWNGYRYNDNWKWKTPLWSGEVDPRFTSQHADTVLFLINKCHIHPKAAIAVVNDISGKEAAILKSFLNDAFITGDYLRSREFIIANRSKFSFESDKFFECMTFLVRHKKMSVLQALQEVEGLDEYQLEVLKDLFDDGLRGKHLRSESAKNAGGCKAYCEYKHPSNYIFLGVSVHVTSTNAVKYFREVFRHKMKTTNRADDALSAAINEINSLNNANLVDRQMIGSNRPPYQSYGINFLRRHIDDDVTVNEAKPLFSSKKARSDMHYLTFFCGLSHKSALKEIGSLNDNQIKIFRDYYSKGVYSEHVKKFPYSVNEVAFMVKQFNMEPVAAIQQLREMNPNVVAVLRELVDTGLNLDEILSLKFSHDFNEVRKYLVQDLIAWNGYNAYQAWGAVGNKTDAELEELMQEQTPQFNSVKLG